jgi:hypothetical protein
MLREWVDACLFANYDIIIETGKDKVARAKGGTRRMLYTNHTAAYDAKNSYDMPDEIPMDFEVLWPYIASATATGVPQDAPPTAPSVPPVTGQDEIAEKKRFQEIAVSLATPLGGVDYVKRLLSELNLTFKTMSLPECEEFVAEVRARVTEEIMRRNGAVPNV